MKRTSSIKTLKPLQKEFERGGRVPVDDGLTLFTHGKSSSIWADYRLPNGKRTRKSTGTSDFARAVETAKRRHRELRNRVASGQSVTVSGVTVGNLLRAYADTLTQRLATGDQSAKPELSVLNRNLVPYWSEVSIDDLSRQTFYAWEKWRKDIDPVQSEIRVYQRGDQAVRSSHKPKPPSSATLQREKTVFVRALTWGSDQVRPWVSDEAVAEIRHLPRRSKSKKHGNIKLFRRACLSDEQIAKLLLKGEEWEKIERNRPGGKQRNYERRLMMCHVRLLLATGLRPGAEINELTWDRLAVVEIVSGEEIVVISPCGDGKTGPRIVNALPEAVRVINDLRWLLTTFGYPTTDNATLWPSPSGSVVKDFNGSFKTVMRKLKFEPSVYKEPLYICRHTYITRLLRKNVSSDIIAQNCGTSVEMIERHYTHLKAEQIRDALVPSEQGAIHGLKLVQSGRQDSLVLDSSKQVVHFPASRAPEPCP